MDRDLIANRGLYTRLPDGRLVPRVSAILSKTKRDAGAFYGWLRRQKLRGDFSESIAACQRGIEIHKAAEFYLQGWPFVISESVRDYWQQIEPELRHCHLILAESQCQFAHHLGFAGKPDLVADWRGIKPVLIDYKTCAKEPREQQINDWLCQLAAYSEGLSACHGVQIRQAIVFAIGSDWLRFVVCDRAALEDYWLQFQIRLAEFRQWEESQVLPVESSFDWEALL